LADVFGWLQNVLLFLMLGLLAAYLVYCERTGKKSVFLMLYLASVSMGLFSESLRSPDSGFGAVLCLIMIGVMGYLIFVKGEWKLDELGRKS